MVNLALLNFILYNFLQNQIKWAFVLNCWDLKSQLKFSQMVLNENIYLQVWNINHINLTSNIEGRILHYNKPQTAVYFDFNCLKSQDFLDKTSEEKLFRQNIHWLIYDEFSDFDKFQALFKKFNMAVDADVTYVVPNINLINSPQNLSLILYDVYNNGYYLGGKLNITIDREILCDSKECHIKQYLSSLNERSKYQHRLFLEDITMRVSTVVAYLPLTTPENQLLEYLLSTTDKHIDSLPKFGFQHLMILKENLHCRFRYNFTNAWSRDEATGGCVGALGIDNSADLASTPFLLYKKRFWYVQAVMEVGYFRQVCMFRTPRNAGIKGRVFLDPFSVKVWLIFGGTLALTAFLLWIVFVVEYHKMREYLNFIPSLLTTCLISFGAACYQGSFIVPNSMGGRIAFFALSLLTFIMYNYYTSIVVSILLGSPVKSNIKTMAQLADSNLEVGFEAIPFTKMYLNVSPLPEIKRFKINKIESKKNPASVWIPVEEGLRRVRENPGFVYVFEALSGYGLVEKSYTDQEICDLNEVLLRPAQPLYTHLNKNSSYREIMKLKQMRILESGVYRRLHRDWVITSLKCHLSSSFVVQVGLEYTAPLFIMLASAYIVVLILVILEILWKKFVEK